MRDSAKFLVSTYILSISSLASALPLGFGRNQGDLEYDQILSEHFSIYHDHRAPEEARVILEALEAARPEAERWLGVQRKTPLNVMLSSTTSNPSFANFLVDAIELQSMARGGRDLAWHEYTHSTMYRHLDNAFGPAGSILHLPWMPAWWIEGLAESFSVSGSSDYQFGIERYFALKGNWPSYDKLHSLYDGSRFSNIGYAISGAFVTYILRTYGTERLPQMLASFQDYSMPWWWVWTFVPWNGFMPMDQALKEYTGKTGIQLYEDYKRDASTYWQNQKQLTQFRDTKDGLKIEIPLENSKPAPEGENPIPKLPGQSLSFSSTYQMQSRGGELFFVQGAHSEHLEAQVLWDKDRAIDWKPGIKLPDEALSARLITPEAQIYLFADKEERYEPIRTLWYQRGEQKHPILTRKAYVSDLFLTRDKLVWFEEKLEWQRLCWIPRDAMINPKGAQAADIHCPLTRRFPRALRFLGQSQDVQKTLTEELWFAHSEETLVGDRHSLLIWNAANDSIRTLHLDKGGKPLSLASNQDGLWLAVASATEHRLRHISAEGQCLAEAPLANLVEKLHNASEGSIFLSLWEDKGLLLVRATPKTLPLQPCKLSDAPTSPLQRAMQYPGLSLSEHLANLNPWAPRSASTLTAEEHAIATAPLLGQKTELEGHPITSEPAAWKAKPIFAFPWIGIDAKGYQLGTLAVPLMDNLQNERLQLFALYGVESRFPDLQLAFVSNRWETTWTAGLFHRQAWNGAFRNRTYYYEEKGAEIGASRYLQSLGTSVRFNYKHAYEEPFIGDPEVWKFLAKGYLRELSLGLSRVEVFPRATLSYGLLSNLATKQLNRNYDYEQLGLSSSLSIPITLMGHPSTQTWGMSYSRVRGSRRKLLKEAYRPLHTFVPGSGGGINEINQTLYGPGALTSAAFGDTQARAQFSWTTPLVEDLARLVHIVYLQRLDFTAFYNYGTAWFHNDKIPTLYDGIRAHGYNLDLQADIKGVKLNLGLGAGQVLGNSFEVYALFGFDALIDQG